MRLLNSLRLLLKADPPTTGVAQGALYYDTTRDRTRVHNATAWVDVDQLGIANPIAAGTTAYLPDGNEVHYFNKLVNDGVLNVGAGATLVGVAPVRPPILVSGTPTVSNSASDNYGISFTIPAGTLATSTGFKFEIRGYAGNTSTNVEFTTWVMIAGTKYGICHATVGGSTANARMFSYEGLFTAKAIGASGSFNLLSGLRIAAHDYPDWWGNGTNEAMASNGLASGTITPTTLNTTVDIPIKIGCCWDSGTNTASYIEGGYVIQHF